MYIDEYTPDGRYVNSQVQWQISIGKGNDINIQYEFWERRYVICNEEE